MASKIVKNSEEKKQLIAKILHEDVKAKETFDDFTAVGIAEDFIEAESEEQMLAAWQHLVDKGLCWKLQGFFGRTAQSLIDKGLIKAKSNDTN